LLLKIAAQFWQICVYEAVDLEAYQFELSQAHHLIVLVINQNRNYHPKYIFFFLNLKLSSSNNKIQTLTIAHLLVVNGNCHQYSLKQY